MRIFVFATLCAALPSIGFAQSFKAQNKLKVVPLSQGHFEVIEANGEGARGIWCAASDYAIKRLGLSKGRIYVQKPRGSAQSQPGRMSVVFTANPKTLPVNPSSSHTVSVDDTGRGLRIQHANLFCRDFFIEQRDVFLRLPNGIEH